MKCRSYEAPAEGLFFFPVPRSSDENEMRKAFTVSERVAIAEAVAERLSGRNGIRHDTATAKEKFPEVTGQTRDIAAAKAGFGSGKTLEAAM